MSVRRMVPSAERMADIGDPIQRDLVSGPARARLSLLTDSCVRIEWAPDGRFVDEPSLFATDRASIKPLRVAVIESRSDPIELTTARMRVNYRTPAGRPGERRDGHAEHGALARADFLSGLSIDVLNDEGRPAQRWRPGDAPMRNLGGTLSTLDGLRGPAPLPHGLLSRDGWALVDDSDGHLTPDGWAVCRSWRGYDTDDRVDWYVFAYGNDYAEALRALTRISGRVPLPRRCMLGSWYSRYWPYTSAEFREIVREFDRRGFPLDVLVLDMDWHSASAHGGWTGWSWNRTLLPDAEQLLAWLRDRGLSNCLNLHPAEGVGSWEDRYPAFTRALGLDPSTGERLPFDAGSKRYMEALFGQVLGPLESPQDADTIPAREAIRSDSAPRPSADPGRRAAAARAGVDFWWLDWQQEPMVRSIPGLTNLTWLNRLFFTHSARGDRRGAGFSRWAGWGDHRHPIHFSGDAHTGWPMLAFQIPFTITAGNVGCFFWTHDIGGHFGPRFEEASTRWVQFGAMSAALRLHSARTAALDRRPWTFAPEHERAMRCAFRLRSALMPTIYTAAHHASITTTPLLRPVWMDHPESDHAYRSPDQYFLGPDLLVAPIDRPGRGPAMASARSVWLPPLQSAGASTTPTGHWVNLTTGERLPAGGHAWVGAAIDEIPVFVRGGAPIFMQPPTQRMSAGVGIERDQGSAPGMSARDGPATHPTQHAVLRFALPHAPVTFERRLYEDDGESQAWESGEHAQTRVLASWSVTPEGGWMLDLTIDGAIGAFRGQPTERRWTIEFIGRGVSIRSCDGSRMCRVSTPQFGPTELPVAAILALDSADAREAIRLRIRLDHASPEAGRVFRAARVSGMLGVGVDPNRLTGLLDSLTDRAQHGDHSDDPGEVNADLWAVGAGVGPALRWTGPCTQRDVAPPVVVVADPLNAIDRARPVRLEIIDRIGSEERPVALLEQPEGTDPERVIVTLAACQPDEPPLGRTAVRSARLTANIAGRDRSITRVLAVRRRPVRCWRVAGPFDWDWTWGIGTHELPVEKAHAPADTSGWRPVGRWAGPATRAGSDSIQTHGARWGLDVASLFPGRKGVTWATTTLLSLRPQRVRLRFETADKLLVRVNGRRVFVLDDHSGSEAASMACDAELLAGVNAIDAKLTHGWNDWGVSVYVEAEHPVEEDPHPERHSAPAALPPA